MRGLCGGMEYFLVSKLRSSSGAMTNELSNRTIEFEERATFAQVLQSDNSVMAQFVENTTGITT